MSDPTPANGETIVQESDPTTGKPTYTTMRRARIKTPRLEIDVTAEIIERATKAESRTCMVAEAIKDKHPWAANVQVDWAEIRVTESAKNLRYIYRMPRKAMAAVLAFDQGLPVEPFTVKTVQATHVVRHSAMKKAAGGEPTAPKGDKAASNAARENRRKQQRAARGEPDEHGQVLPNPEYLAGVKQRLDDPKADLGPAVPMLDDTASTRGVPVMVGGISRPTPARAGKPGQMKFTRRFGAREFYPGDGSGAAGIAKAREEGRAAREAARAEGGAEEST